MLALRQTGIESIWAIDSLLICTSIVAFSMTDTPFTKRYDAVQAKAGLNVES
jgi:hypothetical protein